MLRQATAVWAASRSVISRDDISPFLLMSTRTQENRSSSGPSFAVRDCACLVRTGEASTAEDQESGPQRNPHGRIFGLSLMGPGATRVAAKESIMTKLFGCFMESAMRGGPILAPSRRPRAVTTRESFPDPVTRLGVSRLQRAKPRSNGMELQSGGTSRQGMGKRFCVVLTTSHLPCSAFHS